MTPWQVIEEALARKRPPRGPQWLADQLDETVQVVSNWKARGVPPRRFREIANVLGLTVDQIEGVDPLPWEGLGEGGDWPFSEDLRQKVLRLSDEERVGVERVIHAAIELRQKSLSAARTRRQLDTDNRQTVEHDPRKEEGAGLPQDIDLLAPSGDGRSKEAHRPKQQKGRRGT